MTVQFTHSWRSGPAGPEYAIGDRATFSTAQETFLVCERRVAVYAPAANGSPVPAIVISDASANYDVAAADVGAYRRMVAAGAKTVTFRPESEHGLPANGEWHVRNAAASGDVTLTPGSGVVLNAPADGTLVLEPGMTVTAKRYGPNLFDVIGQTVAA